MPNALRDSIAALAATFATSVVAAICSSNLQDILDLAPEANGALHRPATRRAAADHVATSTTKPAARPRAGRAER